MTVLRSRLLDRKIAEENAKYAAHRKDQVGTGERSEKIRTYNFPQNRVTDHRIEVTLYNLANFIDGDLDPLIEPLMTHDLDEKLGIVTFASQNDSRFKDSTMYFNPHTSKDWFSIATARWPTRCRCMARLAGNRRQIQTAFSRRPVLFARRRAFARHFANARQGTRRHAQSHQAAHEKENEYLPLMARSNQSMPSWKLRGRTSAKSRWPSRPAARSKSSVTCWSI